MKVEDVMTKDVQSCSPETDLAAAAMLMWEHDCGTLPIVDDSNQVVGMITDRDICMAAATKHQDIAGLNVGEVTTGQVYSCTPEQDVRDALQTFHRARVRRLPVVDDKGNLQGILSMNDIVLNAEEGRSKGTTDIPYDEVVNTFKVICAPHRKTAAAGA
jgi:CBS domain-containing protein